MYISTFFSLILESLGKQSVRKKNSNKKIIPTDQQNSNPILFPPLLYAIILNATEKK